MRGWNAFFKRAVTIAAGVLAAVICAVALLLPLRLRELFVFVLHFIANKVVVKARLAAAFIAGACVFLLLVPAYFVVLPVTMALNAVTSAMDAHNVIDERIDPDDIARMF